MEYILIAAIGLLAGYAIGSTDWRRTEHCRQAWYDGYNARVTAEREQKAWRELDHETREIPKI